MANEGIKKRGGSVDAGVLNVVIPENVESKEALGNSPSLTKKMSLEKQNTRTGGSPERTPRFDKTATGINVESPGRAPKMNGLE